MYKDKRKAIIVVGLGYGDEGKGSIVDFLVKANNVHTVIRFNGGPQTAHHVVDSNYGTHCFSQFGSGMFIPETSTFLSRFMLVDPIALEKENEKLKNKGITDCISRIVIDERCTVVTPFHKIINRMLEISRGNIHHGSCGMGVGQAVLDGNQMGDLALTIGDLKSKLVTREKLKFLWTNKVDMAEQLIDEHPQNRQLYGYLKQLLQNDYIEEIANAYNSFSDRVNIVTKDYISKILIKTGVIIFEGAQGILLDANKGFWPYVTKTNTTFDNAYELLNEVGYSGNVHKLGVTRTYSTRHGIGPLVTENSKLTELLNEKHNKFNKWQREFRVGWPDLVSLKYALDIVNGVDSIALTNVDRLNIFDFIRICTGYKVGKNIIDIKIPESQKHQIKLTKLLQRCTPIYENIKSSDLLNIMETRLSILVSIKSIGQYRSDKIQLNPYQ